MQPFATNPALRGNLETQVNVLTELTQKTYDAIRKVSELNLHLAQQMMEDSMNMCRSMMSCSDPFQMTSAAMNQLQPAAEHLRSYQQQLMGLLAGVQTDFTRSAETGISEASRSASVMADQMVRHAASAGQGVDGVGAAHNPT
jgi:phasin family protein